MMRRYTDAIRSPFFGAPPFHSVTTQPLSSSFSIVRKTHSRE
jgi:hypothetical protein